MKKMASKEARKQRISADQILPEGDFRGAQRNKYASRYAAGSSVVVLEPDAAAAFPTAGEANDALRALAAIIRKHRPFRPAGTSRPRARTSDLIRAGQCILSAAVPEATGRRAAREILESGR